MQPSPRRGQLSRPATDSWHMPRAPGQRSLVRYSAGGWRGTFQAGQVSWAPNVWDRQEPRQALWEGQLQDAEPRRMWLASITAGLPSLAFPALEGGSLQEDESDHGIHVHLPLHISGLGTPKHTPVSPVYLPQASRAGVSTPSCG